MTNHYTDEQDVKAQKMLEEKINNLKLEHQRRATGKLNPPYKFDEDKYLQEITNYINATYGQHYSRDKFQATEFIFDGGHGTGFCIGNVLKYAQRYGKKGTKEDARKDLMKVIHYAILQLHVHDNDPDP